MIKELILGVDCCIIFAFIAIIRAAGQSNNEAVYVTLTKSQSLCFAVSKAVHVLIISEVAIQLEGMFLYKHISVSSSCVIKKCWKMVVCLYFYFLEKVYPVFVV